MKRGILLIILSLTCLVPLISAIDIGIKQNYSQGETIIAKISGIFSEPLSKSNIHFYRGHVEVPILFDLAKIQDNYYIHASLIGRNEGNYSISLEDIKYLQAGQTKEDDITKEFFITNQTADFSINPGFIITSNNFKIELQNLKDSDIFVNVLLDQNKTKEEAGFFSILFGLTDDEETEETSVTLSPQATKQLNFDISNVTKSSLSTIKFTSTNTAYEIPVYIILNESAIEKEIKYSFYPYSALNISLSTESNTTKITYLYNEGKDKIENISLEVSDSLKDLISLSKTNIDKIDEDNSSKIEILVLPSDDEKTVNGYIKAISNNKTAKLDLIISYIANYKPIPGEEPVIIDPAGLKTKTCSSLNGSKCTDKQTCTGGSTNSSDGLCCLGECKSEGGGLSGKVLGWMIVIVIVIFLAWFYLKRYRGAKRTVNLIEESKPKI